MSLSGTLEKGAHHQTLDLSEELPPPHHHHPHHHSPSMHQHAAAAPLGSPPPAGAVVVPPPYSAAENAAPPPELRGSLDCWACSVLVTAQNLLIAAVNACLAGLVFGLILSPAIVMVMFGFLCHSTVRPRAPLPPYCSDLLEDGGCVALLVVGFLLVTPLLVLALAAYCRLARRLQLGLCFIPYSRAVYKNLPPAGHRGGCCCLCCAGGGGGGRGGGGGQGDAGKGKVWV